MNIDYRMGWRYASEILHERAARPVEVLVAGLPHWQRALAENLIAAARQRQSEGINIDYQAGVIARAEQELQK